MGYKENGKELKTYGAWPVQPELKASGGRFPHATGHYSPSVRPPLDWRNYD